MNDGEQKYATFGREVARAVVRHDDENAVWRDVVRAHIALDITDPEAIQVTKFLVSASFPAKAAT